MRSPYFADAIPAPRWPG